MKIGKVYSKFFAGEFSPFLYGQYDYNGYHYSLKECLNAYVMKYGPVMRRPGTIFCSEVPVGGENQNNVRLVPFVVNADTVYVLEFSHLKIRIINDDGTYVIDSETNNPYEIVSPYTDEMLANDSLSYAQSSDVLFIAHPSISPHQLSHYGPTDWAIDEMEIKDGPYFAINVEEDKTITPSGKTGTVTLTASFDIFAEEDIGRSIRLQHANTWGWGVITAVESKTKATLEVKSELGGTDATVEWRLGAFSKTTGYPVAVTFHQERLWFGGTEAQPQTVWSSVSADFNNFAPTDTAGDVTDESSIVLTMLSDESNRIQWLKSDAVLLVGTLGAEFKIFTYDTATVLTPYTAQTASTTSLGSEPIKPIALSRGVVFVQRSGRKLRFMEPASSVYYEEKLPEDLNLTGSHIATVGFKHLSFQKEPTEIIWGVLNDGSLVSITFDVEQSVRAWARQRIGGDKSSVHHICCIPVKSALQYRLFLVVDRYINGVKKRSIEYMDNEITVLTEQSKLVHSDCTFIHDDSLNITDVNYDKETGRIIINTENNDSYKDGDYIKLGAFQSDELCKFIATPIPYSESSSLVSNIVGKVFKVKKVEEGLLLLDKYASDTSDGSRASMQNLIEDIFVLGVARKCVTEVDGLEYLEGETVDIVADGSVLPNQVVANGKIVFNNLYARINIGLPYKTYIKTMPVAMTASTGESTLSQQVNINRIFINLFRSLGFKYGINEQNLKTEVFRKTGSRMDEAVPLYTGTRYLTLAGEIQNKGEVVFVQDQPLPLNILSIEERLNVSDV